MTSQKALLEVYCFAQQKIFLFRMLQRFSIGFKYGAEAKTLAKYLVCNRRGCIIKH
jgi:hypothetical protein